MNKATLFWGGFFIIIGLLFLLSNLGIITANVWGLIWPLLLITLGGLVLFRAYSPRSAASESASVPSAVGSRQASIIFRHAAGKLRLKASPRVDQLISGQFGGGVLVSDRLTGDTQAVTLSVPDRHFPFGWLPGGALNWDVEIGSAVPLELAFETGAQETDLDFTGLQVKALRLSTGASTNRIRLPAESGSTRVEIKGGAATFDLTIPPGTAAQIRSSSGLATVSVDTQRFPRVEGGYRSVDYATAANRVDISVESGLATTTIR